MAGEGGTIARLATAAGAETAPFLAPQHLLAANRLEALIRRAGLVQRVTMSYDPTRIGRQKGTGGEGISETGLDARRRLNQLATTLPPDCWSVLFDVCGLGKGLQTIETEHSWPRRSAKLVLRIALSQLAAAWGLEGLAKGEESGRGRAWLPERLPIVPPLEG